MEPHKMHFATRAIHSSQPSDSATGALIAPIYQTSTFEQESPGVNLGFDYSRTNNPSRARLETVLAALEGVPYCATFGSGLATKAQVVKGDPFDVSTVVMVRSKPANTRFNSRNVPPYTSNGTTISS